VSSGDEPKKDERKGFGGLAGMVSNVETTAPEPLASAKPSTESTSSSQAEASNRGQGSAPAAPRPPGLHQPTGQQIRPSSGRKWLIGIAAVLAVAWIVAQSAGKKSSANRGPVGSSGPSRQAAPEPKALDETKPSPGTNRILSNSEIRYCLAEDIRLGGAKGSVNAYADSEVDLFNAMVDDFNGRCGHYRYREGALERARSEVVPHRSELEAEGRSRFDGTLGGAGTNPSDGNEKAGNYWDELFPPEGGGTAGN